MGVGRSRVCRQEIREYIYMQGENAKKKKMGKKKKNQWEKSEREREREDSSAGVRRERDE